MKNLKFLMCGVLLVSLHLTSCKKDADLQQRSAPPENKEKRFETSLTIYNADKTNSTKLRFSAASKELLDNALSQNIEFTLVETPESANEAARPATGATPGDEGSANYSDKDATRLNASLPNTTNEKQVLPEDGIQIDVPSALNSKSFSIEVKTKDLNNSTTRSVASSYYASKFYYVSGWHRIRVTNLMHNSPIRVYFYYYYNYWRYSGYTFLLGYNGWAQYWNCSRTVGARVYYYYYHSYRVNYYRYCN